MRTLKIEGKTGTSEIVLGESVSNLGNYCDLENSAIITDANVRAALSHSFPKCQLVEIGIGEENKTLAAVEKIYEKFLDLGLDRSSCVIGIGGGIVCDVSGFAASTYLRGLKSGFVPTTLLAQVDASIGGKNGVNFKGYKNLVGTIRQPDFVLCDFELLKTLPQRELRNGFAEIVKHGAIGDAKLFSYLEENHPDALSLRRTAIEKVVYDSLLVKSKIVSADELEKGERRKLNFGHTLGHALEKTTGLPHGEAISIGMVAAAKLSVAKGLLAQKDAERIENLLAKLGLPTMKNFRKNFSELEIAGKAAYPISNTKTKADKNAAMDAMLKDKKRGGGKMNFVLLEGIGKAKVVEIPVEEIGGILDDMC